MHRDRKPVAAFGELDFDLGVLEATDAGARKDAPVPVALDNGTEIVRELFCKLDRIAHANDAQARVQAEREGWQGDGEGDRLQRTRRQVNDQSPLVAAQHALDL